MRILWCSNWSAQSSYALQSKMLVPRIRALGHEVTVFELSNGTRTPYEANGVQVLSCIADPLGNDVIQEYVSRLKIDAVISLIDVWRFNPAVWATVPWFPYTPIDHTPVPPLVGHALNGARQVIAMSKFGAAELAKAGCDTLYAPLAFDPAVWQPLDRMAARQALGLDENAFWVTFVGVNDSIPSRKGIPELLTGWQLFAEKHPDAVLYMHTSMHGNLGANTVGGVKIDQIITALGLTPRQVRMVDEWEYRTGIPARKLAVMLAASDVLVLPTRGEGFGLPLIEAQAVGCPVITSKFAAGEELVKAGWLIEGESEWSYQDSFILKPGILSIAECLEAAYEARGDNRLRQIAIDGVQEYTIDHVMQTYWKPTLQTIAETSLKMLRAG